MKFKSCLLIALLVVTVLGGNYHHVANANSDDDHLPLVNSMDDDA